MANDKPRKISLIINGKTMLIPVLDGSTSSFTSASTATKPPSSLSSIPGSTQPSSSSKPCSTQPSSTSKQGSSPLFGLSKRGSTPLFGLSKPGSTPLFGLSKPGSTPLFGLSKPGATPLFGLSKPGSTQSSSSSKQDSSGFEFESQEDALQYYKSRSSTESTSATSIESICDETDTMDHSKAAERQKTWTSNSTRRLVSLRKQFDCSFRAAKAHKTLWNEIGEIMKREGEGYSSQQCQDKWSALKRRYHKTNENNNSTGAAPKSMEFWEEIDEIIGHEDRSKPPATFSTMGGWVHSKKREREDEDENNNDNEFRNDGDEDAADTKKAKTDEDEEKVVSGRRGRQRNNPMVKLMEDYQEKIEERETERLKRDDEKHRDKMNKMDQFLELFRMQMEKKD